MTVHQELRKPCYLPAREISLVEVDSDVPFEIGIALGNATLEDVLRLPESMLAFLNTTSP